MKSILKGIGEDYAYERWVGYVELQRGLCYSDDLAGWSWSPSK